MNIYVSKHFVVDRDGSVDERKHEDLHSDPQNPCKISSMAGHTHRGHGDSKITGDY